jgi:hypothetical protein
VWADADELLDELAVALAPGPDIPAEPTAAELDRLRLAVAARFTSVPADQVVVPLRRRMPGRIARAGSAAAAAIVLSASAAAATGVGVPLPAPVRAVAYAVGLPVDSPALDQTHRHLEALNQAVDDGDRDQALDVTHQLESALARVPEDERDRAESEVGAGLAAARPLLAGRGEPASGQASDEPVPGDRAGQPASSENPTATTVPERADDTNTAPGSEAPSPTPPPAPVTETSRADAASEAGPAPEAPSESTGSESTATTRPAPASPEIPQEDPEPSEGSDAAESSPEARDDDAADGATFTVN